MQPHLSALPSTVMSAAVLAAAAPLTPGCSSPSLRTHNGQHPVEWVARACWAASRRQQAARCIKAVPAAAAAAGGGSQGHQQRLQVEGEARKGECLRHIVCTHCRSREQYGGRVIRRGEAGGPVPC